MERLTNKIDNLCFYDVDSIDVGQKLGQLEDIMDKHNIETTDELDEYLEDTEKANEVITNLINENHKFTNIMEKYHIESVEELDLRLSLMSTFVLDKNKDIKE